MPGWLPKLLAISCVDFDHFFFQPFFGVVFGAPWSGFWGPKLTPKSSKNQHRNWTEHVIDFRIDCGAIFNGFGCLESSKSQSKNDPISIISENAKPSVSLRGFIKNQGSKAPRPSKNRPENYQKGCPYFMLISWSIWGWFWYHFGHQKWSKLKQKPSKKTFKFWHRFFIDFELIFGPQNGTPSEALGGPSSLKV